MIAAIYALILAMFLTASHAEATCAWALWVKVNPTFDPMGWHLVTGVPAWYASKQDCKSRATYRDAGTPSQPGDVMCLPQGVEPMGKVGSYEYRPWRGGGQ
jgi:hypothetical protein